MVEIIEWQRPILIPIAHGPRARRSGRRYFGVFEPQRLEHFLAHELLIRLARNAPDRIAQDAEADVGILVALSGFGHQDPIAPRESRLTKTVRAAGGSARRMSPLLLALDQAESPLPSTAADRIHPPCRTDSAAAIPKYATQPGAGSPPRHRPPGPESLRRSMNSQRANSSTSFLFAGKLKVSR